ncbi:BMP family protein [Paracoccus denitrificans]|uniref:BMP family protein n=1 Tax=Paracoccus denitrificans TaxID=266 RepID=UPI001E4D5379|nr:BMP family protein [Paracoccus denitrificans]UFS64479.1 BMP family protein [Paracoccus denitrificans]
MNATIRLALAASLLAAGASHAQDGELSIAMLIPGKIDDNGFMEAGYNGLLKIEKQFGAKIAYTDQVQPEQDKLEEALRALARQTPDMVIAHGGQNNEAAKTVAAEFPDIPFVVVQGGVTGPNLSSYEVLQEHSAWLGGAAAGLLTQSGVVGHISGIRVTPGLKGRGGFYHGLMHTRPDATFLTIFAGNQDDTELAARVAKAETDQGADIIFTMLNAGRQGATDAMREAGTKQIGNVIDWTKVEPDVFIASAIADVSIPSVQAVQDLVDGTWKPETVKHIGLENPEAVSLTLSDSVPAEIRDRIDTLREQIVTGEIEVSTEYSGPELEM